MAGLYNKKTVKVERELDLPYDLTSSVQTGNQNFNLRSAILKEL